MSKKKPVTKTKKKRTGVVTIDIIKQSLTPFLNRLRDVKEIDCCIELNDLIAEHTGWKRWNWETYYPSFVERRLILHVTEAISASSVHRYDPVIELSVSVDEACEYPLVALRFKRLR